jgi:mannose-6-phosphate isomerase-like protein (cupin superfamily)
MNTTSSHDSQTRNLGKPYMLLTGEGVAGFDAAVKASRISTGGNLSVMESHTKGGAPWHVHSREDEYFYVVEGAIIVHCGEEVFTAGPRSFVFLPRGIPHAWDVGGDGVATLLMMTVPAMLEEFLQEFHAASTREARDAVAAKYGIQFLWDRS